MLIFRHAVWIVAYNHRLRNTSGGCRLTSLSIPIVRRRVFALFGRHDVAGFRRFVKVQLDPARLKLPQHPLHSPLNARIVRAVARDEFLDHGPECRRRQFRVWDMHRTQFTAKQTIGARLRRLSATFSLNIVNRARIPLCGGVAVLQTSRKTTVSLRDDVPPGFLTSLGRS